MIKQKDYKNNCLYIALKNADVPVSNLNLIKEYFKIPSPRGGCK